MLTSVRMCLAIYNARFFELDGYIIYQTEFKYFK